MQVYDGFRLFAIFYHIERLFIHQSIIIPIYNTILIWSTSHDFPTCTYKYEKVGERAQSSSGYQVSPNITRPSHLYGCVFKTNMICARNTWLSVPIWSVLLMPHSHCRWCIQRWEVFPGSGTASRLPHFVGVVHTKGGRPLIGHSFLTANNSKMTVLQTLVTEKQPLKRLIS